jgi:hypothetical protein
MTNENIIKTKCLQIVDDDGQIKGAFFTKDGNTCLMIGDMSTEKDGIGITLSYNDKGAVGLSLNTLHSYARLDISCTEEKGNPAIRFIDAENKVRAVFMLRQEDVIFAMNDAKGSPRIQVLMPSDGEGTVSLFDSEGGHAVTLTEDGLIG